MSEPIVSRVHDLLQHQTPQLGIYTPDQDLREPGEVIHGPIDLAGDDDQVVVRETLQEYPNGRWLRVRVETCLVMGTRDSTPAAITPEAAVAWFACHGLAVPASLWAHIPVPEASPSPIAAGNSAPPAMSETVRGYDRSDGSMVRLDVSNAEAFDLGETAGDPQAHVVVYYLRPSRWWICTTIESEQSQITLLDDVAPERAAEVCAAAGVFPPQIAGLCRGHRPSEMKGSPPSKTAKAADLVVLRANEKAKRLAKKDKTFVNGSLREWAAALDCSPASVVKTEMWRTTMKVSGRGRSKVAVQVENLPVDTSEAAQQALRDLMTESLNAQANDPSPLDPVRKKVRSTRRA